MGWVVWLGECEQALFVLQYLHLLQANLKPKYFYHGVDKDVKQAGPGRGRTSSLGINLRSYGVGTP